MRPSVRASMSAVPPAKVRSQARSAVSTASQRPPTSATTSNTAPIRYSRRRPDRLTQSRRSEEHTSELQSPCNLVCRLLLEKKKKKKTKKKNYHDIYVHNSSVIHR